MIATLPPVKLLTAEEFLELPAPQDGSKQELVRGEVTSVASPGFEHGEVQGNVYFAIKSFLKVQPLGRVVIETGMRTLTGPDSVRGPDISYYSRARVPLGVRIVRYHDQPPDLCVEIVSPGNTRKELRRKVQEYFAAGVRQLWIVDPEERSVTILDGPTTGRTLYDDAILEGGDVLPGFTCRVADFFTTYDAMPEEGP